jgi:hypothetical protein
MRSALILANLRREGPMLTYVAVTLRIVLSKLLLSILQTEYETPLGRRLGHKWVGRRG